MPEFNNGNYQKIKIKIKNLKFMCYIVQFSIAKIEKKCRPNFETVSIDIKFLKPVTSDAAVQRNDYTCESWCLVQMAHKAEQQMMVC